VTPIDFLGTLKNLHARVFNGAVRILWA